MKIWYVCGHLQLVSSIFIKQPSNESILKKVLKQFFLDLGRNMWFSKIRQKLLKLNHLTYIKPKGIWGKTKVITFIWHPRILNFPTCWVTVTLWKSWPTLGDGTKWLIRPYLLACPWTCSTNTFVPTPGFCNWMQNFNRVFLQRYTDCSSYSPL